MPMHLRSDGARRTRTTVYLNPILWRRFRQRALSESTSASNLIERLVLSYLLKTRRRRA
jgi:hypothetical protein